MRERGLSDAELSGVKTKLKDLAFTEQYAKVPLSKIFRAEEDEFGLSAHKRSSEGSGAKIRQNTVVDYDNMDEETFAKLTPEQVDEFTKRQASGGWSQH